MGKNKFINKKSSATFHLMARDSSDPSYDEGPNGDRVFIRVDNNMYTVPEFGEGDNDPDSIFADASEDEDEYGDETIKREVQPSGICSTFGLPDKIRREILELGLPDDGYNYLSHMREIKNTGGGSAYYENTKSKVEVLPHDVKAYDASRVRISGVFDDSNAEEDYIYNVASKTIGVRTERAVDPEIAALLNDSDSRFGSDVEDLDEDFVVQANLLEEGEYVNEDTDTTLVDKLEVIKKQHVVSDDFYPQDDEVDFIGRDDSRDQQPRVRRPLDDEFDMLTLQDYDTDSGGDYSDIDGPIIADNEALADKLNYALKNHKINDLEHNDQYKVPADFLRGNEGENDEELIELAAEVNRRCAEYAKVYNTESQDDKEVVIFEESSDESEKWDCETILTTFSNLDNHPGKIEAPYNPRKKKLSETVSAVSSAGNHVITLRGKEQIPMDFLPQSRKVVSEKMKKEPSQQRKRPNGEESKEEKKERKAAVKQEKREARVLKKEYKGVYRCEGQRAQKVAANSGPSSIHLM
ncbi:hypothetical protein GIB67_014385 [Kingdonia uniflora]|uniref:Low temperature viability protein n=1 Tax=Kingdonia uniflora TaxID=39325 RepID=A0A7J7NRD3_9MAGN|nr:hypothetical protein GIB67_014385 [Kingdonia uniflora]